MLTFGTLDFDVQWGHAGLGGVHGEGLGDVGSDVAGGQPGTPAGHSGRVHHVRHRHLERAPCEKKMRIRECRREKTGIRGCGVDKSGILGMWGGVGGKKMGFMAENAGFRECGMGLGSPGGKKWDLGLIRGNPPKFPKNPTKSPITSQKSH